MFIAELIGLNYENRLAECELTAHQSEWRPYIFKYAMFRKILTQPCS